MDREQEINDYIHGKLDEKSKLRFELDLSENPELQANLNTARDLFEGIKNAEKQELKLRLQHLSKNNEARNSQKKVIKLKPRYLLLVAASLIPIVFLVNSYFLSGNTSNEDLFANYYTSYPNTLQPIVRDNEAINETKKAFIAYESGDFKKAEKHFKTILESDNNPNVRFYYAMSLLNKGENDKALNELNFIKNKTTLYNSQTYWYAALIELKSGNTENALQLLDSLKKLNSGYKQTQIIELQEQLKK